MLIQIVGPTITSDTGLEIGYIPSYKLLVRYITFLIMDYIGLKSWTFQLGHCVKFLSIIQAISFEPKYYPHTKYNNGAYSSHVEKNLEKGLKYEYCLENCVSDCEDLGVFFLVSEFAWNTRLHVGECCSGVLLTSVDGSQPLTQSISGIINGIIHVRLENPSVAYYGFVINENIVMLKASHNSSIHKPVGIYNLKEFDLSSADLVAAHKIDPSNRAVNEKLGQVKQRRNSAQAEIKKTYSKMFS